MGIPAPTRGTLVRRIWAFWPLATGLVALLFLLTHFAVKIEVGDEGVTALGAWRIASGQTPYADFFEIITPLSLYVLALAYKIFGVSVLTGRLVALAYGALLLLGTYLLTRRFVKDPLWQAVPLAVLAPFGVGVWPLPSHHWLVDLFLVFSLLCLDRGLEGGRWRWTLGGGVLCGFGVLSLQDQGGYALLAVSLVWLVFRRHFPARWAWGWFGGLFVSAFALYLLALRAVPLNTLFYDLFWFPLTRYHGIPGNIVGLGAGLKEVAAQATGPAWSVAPVYLSLVLLTDLLLFLLPPLAVAGLVWMTAQRRLPPARTLLLWAFTAAFLGGILHRWSLMNIAWGAALPAVALAAGFDAPPSVARPWTTRLSRGLALLFVLSMVGFSLVRLPLMSPSNLHEVLTPRGTLQTFNPEQARSLQGYTDAILRTVPAGAPAFVRGYVPLVGVLTEHPNPTPFNIFTTPAYNTEEQARAWVEAVERQGVQWGFGNVYAGIPTDPVDQYLDAHFEVAWRNGDYILFKRRAKAE